MYLLKKNALALVACWLMLSSCSGPEPYANISVSEKNGLPRELEYVTAEIPLPVEWQPSQILVATDRESEESVSVQVLDTMRNEGKSFLKIMFPVNVGANGTKTFELVTAEKIRGTGSSNIRISDDGSSLENQTYKATFSMEDDPRGGQINGLFLKNFGNKMLKRGHIAMHWAPNFSKTNGDGYFNMEDFPPSSENTVETGLYQITKTRSGRTDTIPEIYVKGKYTFLAGLPYFIFESTMTMEEEVSLKLLRNDEMTMDSLFTHVTYQKEDGTLSSLQLYDAELDSLENNHIPDDSRFVAFYNMDYGYGLASIRLEYNNTNSDGNPSPLFNPHTKISRSQGNGRYWNRVLIDSATTAPKGSRYHEKNAYLVFEVDDAAPEKQILYYAERLKHPLKVAVK